ncbi:MAG: hypothetical protein ACO317_01400, partial [Aquiluna sp.]
MSAITALVAAGCAPGGTTTETAAPTASQNNSSETSETSGISKEVPTDVDITLTLATWEVGGLFDSIQSIVDAYEAKYPNVTIEIATSSFNDYGQNIKL